MIDELVKHQIYLQRYGSGVYKKTLPELLSAKDEIVEIIASSKDLNKKRELKAQLKKIEKVTDDLIVVDYNEMEDFNEYETGYATKLLKSNVNKAVFALGVTFDTVGVNTKINEKVFSMVDNPDMTINQMIDKFKGRINTDIKQTIQRDLVAGLSTDEISKNVNKLVSGRSAAQAEALTRTIINHIGSASRNEVWKKYDSLLEGEKFLATLDSKTSPICMVNDGKIFPLGKGPIPALHYGCRSIRVPSIKPEYRLSNDNTRSSVNGPVSSKLTYSGWLKTQSKEVQNDILGVERAKLFRSNKLTLSKFVDKKGKFYTLDELKSKS